MKTELNSLGIEKKPSDTPIVVAMSGGVDSSTVAGMMKKEGYNVIGITLKLYDDSKEVAKSKQCCSGQDIMDAKRVANKLGIEHKILYYQDKFKQGVVDNFIESETLRHKPQLDYYASVLSLEEHREIRLGLYFPLLDRWKEWPYV